MHTSQQNACDSLTFADLCCSPAQGNGRTAVRQTTEDIACGQTLAGLNYRSLLDRYAEPRCSGCGGRDGRRPAGYVHSHIASASRLWLHGRAATDGVNRTDRPCYQCVVAGIGLTHVLQQRPSPSSPELAATKKTSPEQRAAHHQCPGCVNIGYCDLRFTVGGKYRRNVITILLTFYYAMHVIGILLVRRILARVLTDAKSEVLCVFICDYFSVFYQREM